MVENFLRPGSLGRVAVIAGAGTRIGAGFDDDRHDTRTQTGCKACYTGVVIQIVGALNGFFLKYFQGQALARLLIFHRSEFNGYMYGMKNCVFPLCGERYINAIKRPFFKGNSA